MKSSYLSVRITAEQEAALQRIANQTDRTISQLVRVLIDQAVIVYQRLEQQEMSDDERQYLH